MSSTDPELYAYYMDHVERIKRHADHVNGVGRSTNSRVFKADLLERIETTRVAVVEVLNQPIAEG